MTGPASATPRGRRIGGSRLMIAAAALAACAAGGCQREPGAFADPADGSSIAPIYQMPEPPDPYHMRPFNMQAG